MNHITLHRKPKIAQSAIKCFLVLLFLSITFSCSARNTNNHASLPSSQMQDADSNQIEHELTATDTSSNISNINNVQPISTEPADSTAYTGDYIIGPEDLLEINVYQVDELKRTLRVSASGFIKLPLTGTIKAAGLTASELEAELMKRYEKYLQEPLVSIFIQEYRSQKITVLGAVKSPRVHTVTNQNYLLDMLTLSGGLTGNAGEICYIRRGSDTIIVNLDELLIKGNIKLNMPVFAGDIIHFPVGGILFVDGAVRSPGSFPLKDNLTLTQAISMARGFNSVAIKSEIKVYRDTGKEKRDVIPVNYDSILAQKTQDIVLKDKDIVIVPTSKLKEFIQSISGATRIGDFSLSGGL